MRIWTIAPLGLALLAAGCGGMREDDRAAARAEQPEQPPIAWHGSRSGGNGAIEGPGRGDGDPRIASERERTGASGRPGESGGAVAPEPAVAATERARGPGSAARAGDETARMAPSGEALTNDQVRAAQRALARMGLYEGEIDGLYGPRTIGAVGEFQSREGMARTRALDARTRQSLRERLAAGDTGDGGETGKDMAAATPPVGSFRSASAAEGFHSPVAGGYQAQDLIGKQVVGANGRTLGEIADVLIDADDRATHVLLDVSGDLGIVEGRQLALPIDWLETGGTRFTTRLSDAELEGLPSYKREGDRWIVDGDGAR